MEQALHIENPLHTGLANTQLDPERSEIHFSRADSYLSAKLEPSSGCHHPCLSHLYFFFWLTHLQQPQLGERERVAINRQFHPFTPARLFSMRSWWTVFRRLNPHFRIPPHQGWRHVWPRFGDPFVFPGPRGPAHTLGRWLNIPGRRSFSPKPISFT